MAGFYRRDLKMSDLFKVTGEAFVSELTKQQKENQDGVSLLDMFEIYVDIASKETNVLSKNDLRAVVYKQFSHYSDFDKIVSEVSATVSNVSTSTENVIKAMEKDDQLGLKHAFNELKSYQKRIFELEDKIYKDDLTLLKNRKYFLAKFLNYEGEFKESGLLIRLNICDFYTLNKEFGYATGDSTIKVLVKLLLTEFRGKVYQLIRYEGNEFLMFIDANDERVFTAGLQSIQDSLSSKKYQSHSGEIVQFNFEYIKKTFSINEDFESFRDKLL